MDTSCDINLDDTLDIDPNFEPLPRGRSNTWPLRPSRELEPHHSPVGGDESSSGVDQHVKDPLGLTTKKSGSRRNAWGNLSYADLITKAIQSSPEKRLTLSQIYDWMVQNVPYFKDKGDSTSSAGWKNSIRHNLSLHNRFMRIQNEGTGKSSWWVLNPDAKPGKTPRRRAVTMDKSYEKRRGRVRKKVEALQAAMENGETLSLNGSDDLLEMPTFGDFRSRTDSTASSGRLSPIHAATEPDLHENQVPPMSPIPWETEVSSSPTLYPVESYHELVKSLVAGMKISNQDGLKLMDMSDPYQSGSSRDFSNRSSPYMDVNHSSPGLDNHYSNLPAPPPYPKPQQQMNGIEFDTSNFSNQLRLQCTSSPVINGSTSLSQSDFFNDDYIIMNIKQEPEDHSPAHLATPNSLSVNTQVNSPDRSQQGSPIIGAYARLSSQAQPGLANGRLPLSPLTCQVSPQHNRNLIKLEPVSAASLQQQQQQALHQVSHDSILREALTRGSPVYRSQSTTNTPSPTYSPIGNHSPLGLDPSSGNINNGLVNIGLTLNSNASPHHQGLPSGHMQVMNETFTDNQCITSSNGGAGCNNNPGVPLDIDIDFMSGLDYDMDQVIKDEIRMEGKLDFNFESAPATSVG